MNATTPQQTPTITLAEFILDIIKLNKINQQGTKHPARKKTKRRDAEKDLSRT